MLWIFRDLTGAKRIAAAKANPYRCLRFQCHNECERLIQGVAFWPHGAWREGFAMMLRGMGKKAVVTGVAMAGAGEACTGAVVAAYAVGRVAKRSASLRGRVAVITGSSRGLGLALA